MKCSKFIEEMILLPLKQVDTGQPVGDVCRQTGVSEATFYVWMEWYGNLDLLDVPALRQLREPTA